MIRDWVRSVKGFTIAETAIVLAVASIVTAAVVPAVQDYVVEARLIKAREDTHTIAGAFGRFVGDVVGQSKKAGGWATFDLLVSLGEVPAVGSGGDTAWAAATGTAQVGLLGDQLIGNVPGYSTQRPSMVNWIRGWHGPYLEAGVGSDPWGHRYAVNVKWLGEPKAAAMVLSAGPNGTIETPYRTTTAVPGGDDLIGLVSPGS